MSVDRGALDGTRRDDRFPLEALLVDWQAPLLRMVEPERDLDHVMAMATVRGSVDRLRRRGVRIVVVADRMTSTPPRYQRVESLLGPVDMWCVADAVARAAGAGTSGGAGASVVETAAQALGVDTRTCALLTPSTEMADAGRRAGVVVVAHRPIPPGRPAGTVGSQLVATTAFDLSDAIDGLLAGAATAPTSNGRCLYPLPSSGPAALAASSR